MAAAVLATAWMFRVIRSGQLPGNLGDARWTIGVHEHWYRVWTGQESIRDLHYYFPLPNTLGTSEAFFLQGQFYSLARLLGFGLVDAWLIANIAFFLIGALGVAVLARQVLRTWSAQTVWVVLSIASYPVFVAYAHVQLYGMLTVSWIFVGLCDLVGGRHRRRGTALLLLAPPLLALSSWYALVLGAVVLVFLGLAVTLVSSRAGISRTVRHVAGVLIVTLRSVLGIVLVVLFVLLWAAVLWIYLPSRGVLPPPGWIDVQLYSPRWSDLVNATWAGGGLWSWLYLRIPGFAESTYEQQRGFTPILFVSFVVVATVLLRLTARGRRSTAGERSDDDTVANAQREAEMPGGAGATEPIDVGRPGLLAVCLTIAAVFAFFLIDGRGFTFFEIAWSNVPGFESIRAPFRVMTILYAMALFVLARSAELVWRDWPRLRVASWRRAVFLVIAVGLAGLVFLEMQRTLEASWTRDDLLPADLLAQVEPAQESCDAVILQDEDPGGLPWMTPVNAVIFATVSGVPTPQGYSRADPANYPGPVADDDGAALVQWMREHGFEGRTCLVSSSGVRVLPG